MNRRVFLRSGLLGTTCACLGAVGCRQASVPATPRQAADTSRPRSANEALEELLAGNRRFMTAMAEHRRQSGSVRMSVAEQQRPFATIIGCADSRVPPSLIFDQGLGDLFVVREAGHVIDEATLASVEYAVGHLDTRLILVLGHERCGAVTAALQAMAGTKHTTTYLDRLVDQIRPAVAQVPADANQRLDRAVRANIRHAVDQVRQARMDHKSVRVAGAYYHLATGEVEMVV